MSEEIQTNNTIKRKRASASMGEWERVTIQNGGNICIITEKDAMKMDAEISKIPQLENEISTLKAQLKQGNAEKKAYENALLEERKKAEKVEKIVLQQNAKIEEFEQEKIRLQETYKALAEEYSKLKTFKENAGRGRQNVLTPEQVGTVRQLAMSGESAIKIHAGLEFDGVEVSYETIRKLVAEVKKPKQTQAVELVEEEIMDFDLEKYSFSSQKNSFSPEKTETISPNPLQGISEDFRKRD